jgi:hypothetical protein
VTRGHILLELDRLDDARSTLETGRRISEELGVRWPLPSYQIFLALERFLVGEWDDALAELEAAMELVEETGERYSLVLGHSVRALIAPYRGELRTAQEAAAGAASELTTGGHRYRSHWATWVEALLPEAEGASAEALAALTGVWDRCERIGLAVEYPVLGPDLVRLSLAANEQGRASQVAAAVAEVAARNDVPSLSGAALRCRGLAEDDPGLLCASVDAYATGPPAPSSWPWPATRPWTPPAGPPGPRQGCASWASAEAAAVPQATPDRRAPVRLPAHGPDPCRPCVHQAGDLLTHPACRRGDPPPGLVELLWRRVIVTAVGSRLPSATLYIVVRGDWPDRSE